MELWEWEGCALCKSVRLIPSVPKPMAISFDERKLVAAIRAGSREGYELLLDAYGDRVFNLVCRMVGAQDAEDVVQEALVEVCRSVAGFRGRSSLNTWVHRVAVNVCLEHRRKRRPEVVPFDDLAETHADSADDPAAVAVRSEVRGKVDAAIDALPTVHRDVVILHELQGLTYQECADVLGCPVGTVKSRLSNAFAKLREMLKDYACEAG